MLNYRRQQRAAVAVIALAQAMVHPHPLLPKRQ
jgi:hypothetical protein